MGQRLVTTCDACEKETSARTWKTTVKKDGEQERRVFVCSDCYNCLRVQGSVTDLRKVLERLAWIVLNGCSSE